VTGAAPKSMPSDPLRAVPVLLRRQWKTFVGSRAIVMRWMLADDEWEWVEAFLEGRLEGATKVFVIEEPADRMDDYGFVAGRPLMVSLAKTKFAGRHPWTGPPLQPGMRDTDVLAAILGSFARHAHGTWLQHVALVLAPERIKDERAWIAWVHTLVDALAQIGSFPRIVLLEDARRSRYEDLARLGPVVHTVRASLELPTRATAMAEAASDARGVDGQMRLLAVRVMQCVNEGRVDDANRMAAAVEALAKEARMHGSVVPVRFAVANAMTAAHRHTDAVTSYRAAEIAAEHAEAHGDPGGLWLRIMARFGVGCGLLAASHGFVHAAGYYEETAPLCQKLGDPRLELEAYRCAAIAYELAKAYRPAWDVIVKALGVVDRLDEAQREQAMLVPLADAMLRLVKMRELSSHRAAVEHELRKRRMRGSEWA
jgi:hypothetical protein